MSSLALAFPIYVYEPKADRGIGFLTGQLVGRSVGQSICRSSYDNPNNRRSAAMEANADLECPVCLQTRHDCRIYQCSNGHLICDNCYKQVRECPTCREQLPTKPIRCIIAEKEIAKLPRKCR